MHVSDATNHPLSEAVIYFAVKRDSEAGGLESTNLGICIEDMLAHYACDQCNEANLPDKFSGLNRITCAKRPVP